MPVKHLPADPTTTPRWAHMYQKVLDAAATAFAEKGYEGFVFEKERRTEVIAAL